MSLMETVGSHSLSDYLGVSITSIRNWRMEEGNDFPDPVTCIKGRKGSRTRYGWREDQIPQAREWYARRFGLETETAEARWKGIDTRMESGEAAQTPENIHPDQLLISIPMQRTGEFA